MFEGLIWAASLLVSCNLVSADIINIAADSRKPVYQRECKYRCQDKSIEIQNTNKQYQCPNTLQIPRPVNRQNNTYNRDVNPNLYVPKTPWYRKD